jgi:hypothetical protein
MRQGNDVGTQYRSTIYTQDESQAAAAEASRDAYQPRLTAAGFGPITTEIAPAGPFYFAEAEHQQYLSKNPGLLPRPLDRRAADRVGIEGQRVERSALGSRWGSDFQTRSNVRPLTTPPSGRARVCIGDRRLAARRTRYATSGSGAGNHR